MQISCLWFEAGFRESQRVLRNAACLLAVLLVKAIDWGFAVARIARLAVHSAECFEPYLAQWLNIQPC